MQIPHIFRQKTRKSSGKTGNGRKKRHAHKKSPKYFEGKKNLPTFASANGRFTLPSLRQIKRKQQAGPFVYRLGRKIFILERGVRFSHGLRKGRSSLSVLFSSKKTSRRFNQNVLTFEIKRLDVLIKTSRRFFTPSTRSCRACQNITPKRKPALFCPSMPQVRVCVWFVA